MFRIFVARKAGTVSRYLEEYAARLTEVDRSKVIAVDDFGYANAAVG